MAEKLNEKNAEFQTDKWPYTMKLPCRHCGVKLPLSIFTLSRNYDEIWTGTISKGRDLACRRCLRRLGRAITDDIISCDRCCTLQSQSEFAPVMRMHWAQMREDKAIVCMRCTGELSKGKQPLDLLSKHACCGKNAVRQRGR